VTNRNRESYSKHADVSGPGIRPVKRVTPEKVNYSCAFVSLFDGMTLAFGRVWAA
jgi:hypothetical protein